MDEEDEDWDDDDEMDEWGNLTSSKVGRLPHGAGGRKSSRGSKAKSHSLEQLRQEQRNVEAGFNPDGEDDVFLTSKQREIRSRTEEALPSSANPEPRMQRRVADTSDRRSVEYRKEQKAMVNQKDRYIPAGVGADGKEVTPAKVRREPKFGPKVLTDSLAMPGTQTKGVGTYHEQMFDEKVFDASLDEGATLSARNSFTAGGQFAANKKFTKDGRVRKMRSSQPSVKKPVYFPIPGEGEKETVDRRKKLWDAGFRDAPAEAGDRSDMKKWRKEEFDRITKNSGTFEKMHEAAQKSKVEKTKGAKKNIK